MRVRYWLLAALPLLTSCAPAPPGPELAAPQPAGAVEREPDRGGTILYSYQTTAPPTLHPYKGGAAGTDERKAAGPAYETLVSFDWRPEQDYRIDFRVVPWLAERWEQAEDRSYVFHLRKGVAWHDGEPFTAGDVVFSYSYVSDPKNAFPRRSLLRNLDRVDQVDDHTVRVTMRQASPYFLQDLAHPALFIVPKHVVDRGETLDAQVVGTGPYRLKSSVANANVFERFDGYWQTPKPYPDGLRVVFGLDLSTAFAAFVAGETDVVEARKGQEGPIQRAVPQAQLRPTVTDVGIALRVHVDRPPFNDIRARRALHLAIDRQALLQVLTDGKGAINPPGVPGNKTGWAIPPEELSSLPGYRQPKTGDLSQARQLLAEAGYTNLKFRILHTSEGSVAPLVIEPLIAQLREIGVDAEADGRDNATFTKLDADGEFETALTYTAKMNIVQYVPDRFRSGSPLNKTGVTDQALDEAIDTILTNFDQALRKAAARRMQEVLLEKLYFIPLIDTINYQVLQPWVRDFPSTDGITLDTSKASYIWLDRELLPPGRL